MQFSSKNLLKRSFQFLIGLFLLIIIYLNFGISIEKFNVLYLIYASLLYFILNLMLSFRIWKILCWIGYKTKYFDILLSHLGGMIIGDFTPGRSGYLATPFFIREISGPEVKAGLAAILVSQAFEFIVKIIGAFFAMLLLFAKDKSLIVTFLLAALFLSTISLFLLHPSILASIPLIRKITGKFQMNFDEFLSYLTKVRSCLLYTSPSPRDRG